LATAGVAGELEVVAARFGSGKGREREREREERERERR